MIGTNNKDAQETTSLLLQDAAAGLLPKPFADPDELIASLRDGGLQLVAYDGWEAIDAHERGAGERHGWPRITLVRHADLLHRAAPPPL